jgi:hypothetical protein
VFVGLPQGDGGLAILFYFFCLYLFIHFISVYFYNTHQGVGGVAILFYFISFQFIFITRTRCSWGSPKGLVALLFILLFSI